MEGYNKTCCKNDQKKSITDNRNGKWCAQGEINNTQKSVLQKKDAYDDVINKYIQKMNDQRRKSLILHEEAIEKYEAFKNAYTN